MPTTPDRPDGRPAGPDDEFDVAGAALGAARETVPVDTRPASPERRAIRAAVPERGGRPGNDRPPALTAEPADRPTVPLDNATRDTVDLNRADLNRADLDREALGRRPTVKVPGQRRPPGPAGRAPLAVAAGFATLWAALLSYLPVFAVVGLARTLEGSGGLGGAAEAGLAGWLLGHWVPIGTSIGPLALAPLLLTILATWRLNRAGLHVTRAIGARHSGSPGVALRVAAMIAVAYAILGWLAALVVDGPGTEVSAGRAALNFFLLGLTASLVGALRGTDGLATVARRMPPPLRHGLRTGVVSAMLLVAIGGALAGLSVALGAGQAADMIAAYRTGVAGQAGITLLSLAYGANAAVWAASYLLGPGFLLGADSAVRLTEVSIGPLPTLPLLAGLPNGPVGAAGAVLLAVPVLVGMSAGWLLTRRLSHGRGHGAPKHPVQGGPSRPGEPPHHSAQAPWSQVIGAALIAGPVTGLTLGVLAWLSGGALGNGRLAQIGPIPWEVAVVATAVVGVSTTIGAAAARAFRSSPTRP